MLYSRNMMKVIIFVNNNFLKTLHLFFVDHPKPFKPVVPNILVLRTFKTKKSLFVMPHHWFSSL